MGQDVGQAHVLLLDTLRTDRSARPSRGRVSMWWRTGVGDRRSHPTQARLWSGDEESDSLLHNPRKRHSVGHAGIVKRSHGSKRLEQSACLQSVTAGNEAKVTRHTELLTHNEPLSLTSPSPSRREAETGIWKLLPTPECAVSQESRPGIWNLESEPSPPGQERNLESGIWNLPRPPRPPLGEWVLESGIWKLPCWNLLAGEGPEAAKLESGNCLRDLEHEIIDEKQSE